MKFAPSLSLSNRLELKLQPRQILCNELLMLPVLALENKIQEELVENIFLEAEERGDVTPSMPEIPQEIQMTPPGGDHEPPNNGEEAAQDSGQLGELLEYLGQSKSSVTSSGGDLPEEFSLENRASLPASWRVQLAEALRLERMPDAVARAAEYMVESLDERGYLTESLEEISDFSESSVEDAQEALEILQRVALPGVGARDLRERMLLMAQAQPERNHILERLLRDYYKELLDHKFDVIRKKMGISEDELMDAISEMKSLYHEAPSMEDNEPVTGVTPDAIVVKKEGRWVVELRDSSIPKLRLSSYAQQLLKQADRLTPKAKEYMDKYFNRAKFMMEAIEQRRSTLRRIIEKVVELQQDFFDYGAESLHPLRQEDIAEELSLHASTVSRAVQEKYIETSYGVYPLKRFFPRGVSGNNGQLQARNSVQERLAALVAAEDPNTPLSDDELVDMLKSEGIKLSRRTVCKYRDELKILPANKRKGLTRMKAGSKGMAPPPFGKPGPSVRYKS